MNISIINFKSLSFNFREYPVSGGLPGNSRRPEDKPNYVLLLKELRRQLDAIPNKKYLLTVAYVIIEFSYRLVEFSLLLIELELVLNV